MGTFCFRQYVPNFRFFNGNKYFYLFLSSAGTMKGKNYTTLPGKADNVQYQTGLSTAGVQ